MATNATLYLEFEQGDEAPDLLRAARFCIVAGILIFLSGFYFVGTEGMLHAKSPDFMPLPHFFAAAAIGIGVFFLVRAYYHSSRYRLFGTSSVECNRPALGEVLAGTLRVAKADAITAPMQIQLRCDWRHRNDFTPSQHSRNVTDLMWEETQEVPSGGAMVGVPFRFIVPATGLPSGQRAKPKTGVHPESPGTIVWTLKVTSPRSGMDYLAEFEIPIKPGKIIAALAANVASQQSRPALESDPSRPAKLAGAALTAASLVLGGHVPTQDELDDEDEARSRPEPDRPFAGTVEPVQPAAIFFWRIVLGLGLLLTLISVIGLARQVMYTQSGVVEEARVVETIRQNVTLNFGADDAAHLIHVSPFHYWETGQVVEALCVHDEQDKRRCLMESGKDRWLESLATLVVGIAALGIWRLPRRQVVR